MQEVTTRTTCRVCGSDNLTPLFSLGDHYVSDFVTKENVYAGAKAPLELEMCECCTLVQLKHTAPQELLYKRHYWYRSGVTQTMRDALKDVVRAAQWKVDLRYGDIVLDIGSNDGTLLRNYDSGLVRIGVEPADNLATKENYQGLELVHDFWPVTSGKFLPYDKARVITALGMFYDLEDPNAFIKGVAQVLHPDGVFIAQLMCLKNMLNVRDVGNICHEHLEYYTLKSLEVLLGKHGLEIVDLKTVPVNGESYRLFIKHKGQRVHERVGKAFVQETGIRQELQNFWTDAEVNKRVVVRFIKDAVAQGKHVWVYGASTKGNTILQYYGLDHTLIEGAADRSPEKHGLYTVGTGIPIYSEEYARERANYFLVLPYTFLVEFMEREAAWRRRGGKFIVPLPELRIV